MSTYPRPINVSASLALALMSLTLGFDSEAQTVAEDAQDEGPQVETPQVVAGETFRARINEVFERAGVGLCASGVGSLMNIHGVPGPVSVLADLAGNNDAVKEILFLDLLERGIYMARRGFIALSMVVTEDEMDRFIDTLDEVIQLRRPLLGARRS